MRRVCGEVCREQNGARASCREVGIGGAVAVEEEGSVRRVAEVRLDDHQLDRGEQQQADPVVDAVGAQQGREAAQRGGARDAAAELAARQRQLEQAALLLQPDRQL